MRLRRDVDEGTVKVDRNQLDQARADIRGQIVAMSADAGRAVRAAADALDHLDPARADAVIAGDAAFNRQNEAIHEACITLVARQQPVASDLREILADLQIAVELERIADHAADIARISKQLVRAGLPPVWTEIQNMAVRCGDMLGTMMAAFRDRDTVAAEVIAGTDDDIDRLNDQIVNETIAFMTANPTSVANGTRLIWLTHNLERIGDRVTNIGEQILFAESGRTSDLNRPK
jgi:phosphate transport system protein